MFLSLSAKKEEEDLEDKKSIKKRIKELKVLDPKIAQNLCKYLLFLSAPLLPGTGFMHNLSLGAGMYLLYANTILILSPLHSLVENCPAVS